MTVIDEAADALSQGRGVRVESGRFVERRCFLAATAAGVRPRRPGVPYLRLERRRPGLAEEFDAVWTDLPGMKGRDVSLPGGAWIRQATRLIYSAFP
jgi:hypothetical protein